MIFRYRHILCVALGTMGTTLGGGCSDEGKHTVLSTASIAGNRPPVVTFAKILNSSSSSSSLFTVLVQAEDPEREAVSFQYRWYVDNVLMAGQTGATLPPDLLKRGQTVFVEVVPSDGTNKGQPYRTMSMEIGNTAPKVVAISLTPHTVRSGDRLEAQVETNDLDHDRVDLTYKWYRNNTVVKEGEESFLDTTGFVARDGIQVEVTAHDSTGSVHSLKSEPLVLGNSGPKIVSTPPSSAVRDRFDYSVKAMDPDGDRLTYHLETAPDGMTIDSQLGRIGWQIPADQRGTFHIKVVTKDGQGGYASQEFDLTLGADAVSVPGSSVT